MKAALDVQGYCVVRDVIDQTLVDELKADIDRYLDPDGELPEGGARGHRYFIDESEALLKLLDNDDYMNIRYNTLGTKDVCFHRSAAILRNPGNPTGNWHSDHHGDCKEKRTSDDFLNIFSMPSGCWFYLNGSHPGRSGIAVLEGSHKPNWQAPEGFHLDSERRFIYRDDIGEENGSYKQLDIPGVVPVISNPGDLIMFSDKTYHVNMETNERRYSCAIGFRPKAWKVDAPWDLPESSRRMIDRLPERHKHFVDGYTGIDDSWTPDQKAS